MKLSYLMQYLNKGTHAELSQKFTDISQAASAFSVSTTHPEIYKLQHNGKT